MSGFYYTAEARSKATGHTSLDRDLHARFAINPLRLENGSKRPIHRFRTAGKDLIGPLNEVSDHVGCKSAMTTAAVVGRYKVLDAVRQLGCRQQSCLVRGSHHEYHIEAL